MHVAVHRLGQRCSGPLVQVVCGKALRQTKDRQQGTGGHGRDGWLAAAGHAKRWQVRPLRARGWVHAARGSRGREHAAGGTTAGGGSTQLPAVRPPTALPDSASAATSSGLKVDMLTPLTRWPNWRLQRAGRARRAGVDSRLTRGAAAPAAAAGGGCAARPHSLHAAAHGADEDVVVADHILGALRRGRGRGRATSEQVGAAGSWRSPGLTACAAPQRTSESQLAQRLLAGSLSSALRRCSAFLASRDMAAAPGAREA